MKNYLNAGIYSQIWLQIENLWVWVVQMRLGINIMQNRYLFYNIISFQRIKGNEETNRNIYWGNITYLIVDLTDLPYTKVRSYRVSGLFRQVSHCSAYNPCNNKHFDCLSKHFFPVPCTEQEKFNTCILFTFTHYFNQPDGFPEIGRASCRERV